MSGDEYKEFGGNTPCLEVVYEKKRVIFDAGTGIRPLGAHLAHGKETEFDLFLSHTHWDHLIGLPFFDPLHHAGNQVNLWLPEENGRSGHEVIGSLLASEFFPVHLDEIQADVRFHTIHVQTPVKRGPIEIDFHRTNHPGMTVGFKIRLGTQTIGYITDNELLQGYHGNLSDVTEKMFEPYQHLIAFLKGCDLVIHEAQYTSEEYHKRVGWGHSSFLNALAFIKRTGAPRWIVTHHDPRHGDRKLDEMEQEARRVIEENGIACQVEWARDGFVLEL